MGRGRVVQRHLLYLAAINSSPAAAWLCAVEVVDADTRHSQTLALFWEDRLAAFTPDASVVQLLPLQMRLCRPRQFWAGWLAGLLWHDLVSLDRFWAERLAPSRKGTQRDQVL
jgi:hypothetical protein